MKRAGGFFGHGRVSKDLGPFSCQLAIATVDAADVPDHVHDEAHLVLAIDRGYISAARREVPTEAPFTFIYNPPGTDHRDRFTETGARFFAVEVAAHITEEIVGPGPFEVQDQADRSRLGELALRVARGDESIECEGLLFDIVAGVAEKQGASGSPTWLRRSHEAIRVLHRETDLTVDALAAAADVHPVHLSRTYRRQYGIGPAEAIQRARLESAIVAMNRRIGLAEIAAEAGFSDQAHLSRSFRRFYGMTPSGVREALR